MSSYAEPNELTTTSPLNEEAGHRYNDLLVNLAAPVECFKDNGTGSEVIIRSIIPIIDMFSNEVDKNKSRKKRREILKELGIDYPEIFWSSMRHGLIHSAKQPQAIRIAGEEGGIIVWYSREQNSVSLLSNGSYTINPILFYEKTLSWLKKLSENQSNEFVTYTYMLEVDPAKGGELLVELTAVKEEL